MYKKYLLFVIGLFFFNMEATDLGNIYTTLQVLENSLKDLQKGLRNLPIPKQPEAIPEHLPRDIMKTFPLSMQIMLNAAYANYRKNKSTEKLYEDLAALFDYYEKVVGGKYHRSDDITLQTERTFESYLKGEVKIFLYSLKKAISEGIKRLYEHVPEFAKATENTLDFIVSYLNMLRFGGGRALTEERIQEVYDKLKPLLDFAPNNAYLKGAEETINVFYIHLQLIRQVPERLLHDIKESKRSIATEEQRKKIAEKLYQLEIEAMEKDDKGNEIEQDNFKFIVQDIKGKQVKKSALDVIRLTTLNPSFLAGPLIELIKQKIDDELKKDVSEDSKLFLEEVKRTFSANLTGFAYNFLKKVESIFPETVSEEIKKMYKAYEKNNSEQELYQALGTTLFHLMYDAVNKIFRTEKILVKNYAKNNVPVIRNILFDDIHKGINMLKRINPNFTQALQEAIEIIGMMMNIRNKRNSIVVIQREELVEPYEKMMNIIHKGDLLRDATKSRDIISDKKELEDLFLILPLLEEFPDKFLKEVAEQYTKNPKVAAQSMFEEFGKNFTFSVENITGGFMHASLFHFIDLLKPTRSGTFIALALIDSIKAKVANAKTETTDKGMQKVLDEVVESCEKILKKWVNFVEP